MPLEVSSFGWLPNFVIYVLTIKESFHSIKEAFWILTLDIVSSFFNFE